MREREGTEVRSWAWEPIRKDGRNDGFNLADYDTAVREFSWQRARFRLDGLPGGRGLNIAHEAVDRHAAGPRSDAVALRCVAKDGSVSELTYADLARQTNRFANVLRSLGVGQGRPGVHAARPGARAVRRGRSAR